MTSFMRKVEVHINNRIFDGDDFEIMFDVPFDDDAEPNEAKFEIYNLSKSTINSFKKDVRVIINAGYKDSYGTILLGTVSKRSSDPNSVDQLTTVHIIDSTDKWTGRAINKTYKKNIKANQIITDLSKVINLPLVMKLPKNVTYPKGFTANGKFMDIVKQIAKDCKAIAYINKNKLFVRSSKDGDNIRFILNSETGLIGSPEFFEDNDVKGYKVKCLLNHRISTASIIQLESIIVKGTYRVRKGRHYGNGNDFYTEMEVVAV